MTQDRFADLLQYPHLDELPDEAEVNSALVRYPYCQSFHTLRAKLHEYTRHVNAKKSLNMAAAYSTDRTFLYHAMKNLHKEKTTTMPEQVVDLTRIFEEPTLVLDELPVSQFEILAAPIEVSTNGISTNGSLASKIEVPDEIPFEIAPFDGIFIEEDEPLLTVKDLFEIDENVHEAVEMNLQQVDENDKDRPLVTLTELFEIEEDTEEEIKIEQEKINEIEPEKKVEENLAARGTHRPGFTDWLMDLEAPQVALFGHTEEVKKSKKVKKITKFTQKKTKSKSKVRGDKGKRLKKLIEKSVKENDGLVSETLVNLLVLQGKNKKAIKMYEQLSLKFPEKSAYFAAQIRKLMNEL